MASWERVQGLISHVCYGERKGERHECHVFTISAMGDPCTSLDEKWAFSSPSDPAFPGLLARTHDGQALGLALPAPIWYLYPQPPGFQVPSSPPVNVPGVADDLNGCVSTGFP